MGAVPAARNTLVGGSQDPFMPPLPAASPTSTTHYHASAAQENSHEFRRLTSSLGAARDRVALMAGVSSSPGAHVSLNVQGSTTGALLRERGAVTSSTHAIDEVLNTAQAVSNNLMEQRGLLDTIGQKVVSVGVRFPVVNSLLNAIRRKKSKDTMVLAGVIAACLIFTLMYLAFK
jgi:Golgi SNAP receptor complex protein 1